MPILILDDSDDMENGLQYADKCVAILEWAQEHPRFDPGFVESVLGQIREHGTLSEAQMSAINNIIDRFEIEF